MAIKVIPFNHLSPFLHPVVGEKDDCIVLRMYGRSSETIELAFPFHEDTPNFILNISEALDLKNAIEELIDLKLLEKPKEDKYE